MKRLFAFALALLFTWAPPVLADKLKILVVSGDDHYHDWRKTTPQLRENLESSGLFDVRVVEDTHILESAAALSGYAAIFFNQQVPESTAAMRENLTRYLKQGGGLVVLHWGIDNFHDWPAWRDILGRGYKEGVSAEEHGVFDVTIRDHAHPITRGLADFRSGDDEGVHYKLVGDAPIDVLATSTTELSKDPFPVMFTHTVGKGRVFFSPLGHSAATRETPSVKKMIVRATEWAARGEVTD